MRHFKATECSLDSDGGRILIVNREQQRKKKRKKNRTKAKWWCRFGALSRSVLVAVDTIRIVNKNGFRKLLLCTVKSGWGKYVFILLINVC